MPYDQHFLVAAPAPRYVYVGSAVGDIWSDPKTEYISACAAGEVYEQLSLSGLVHPNPTLSLATFCMKDTWDITWAPVSISSAVRTGVITVGSSGKS